MSKIFSFDAETNGLYGEVWAIGAVRIPEDEATQGAPTFSGMIDPFVNVTDQWTKDNVVPLLVERVQDENGNDVWKPKHPLYPSRTALLNAFWAFWMEFGYPREDVITVANYGVPVEAGLFRACVEIDPERAFAGPLPLHELASFYLAAGYDPRQVDSFEFAGKSTLAPHDPLNDAIVAGLATRRLERERTGAGILNQGAISDEELLRQINGDIEGASWTKDEIDAITVDDPKTYPFKDGDVLVLGPEVIAEPDGSVLNWKGENYVRQEAPTPSHVRETPVEEADAPDPVGTTYEQNDDGSSTLNWRPEDDVVDEIHKAATPQ